MRILDGRELADYVKERQAKQVRKLRQTWKVFPKLVIVIANDDPIIDTYVRLKQVYGEDILTHKKIEVHDDLTQSFEVTMSPSFLKVCGTLLPIKKISPTLNSPT